VVPERLWWDPEGLARFEWLVPLLDVPADANPPLAMTPPPSDAVGTYGWSAGSGLDRHTPHQPAIRVMLQLPDDR
jgi:hypothetical protein